MQEWEIPSLKSPWKNEIKMNKSSFLERNIDVFIINDLPVHIIIIKLNINAHALLIFNNF